jgi:molybdate transport system substrate-binding protein
MNRKWLVLTGALFALIGASVSNAAEIKLLSPVAMRGVIPDLSRQFEQASSNQLTVEYATVGTVLERLRKSEPADVAILTGPQMDELQKQGKIKAGSQADFAQVGVGVFVRAGAPKPDISSVDAFKRTLVKAKSISYGDPAGGGVSGTHMASLIERLGISPELKPRTHLFPNSQDVLKSVAKGENEIGFGLTSDTELITGVELVGGLPGEIQSLTVYAAGIVAGTNQADAAKAFMSFLRSPATQAVLKSKGFEPR